MPDATDVRSRLEEFFRARSDDPDSVKVTDHEVITGGYSRAMARVSVEDSTGRHGYIVRSDPPPGQSIIDTDRGEEWALLTALHEAGTISMPAPRWFDPTGAELGSPSIVIDLVPGSSLIALSRTEDPSEHGKYAERMAKVIADVHRFDLSRLRASVRVPASWEEYIDSRIQMWVDVERTLPDSQPFMRLIASWLRANRPPPVSLTLVHGDFQIGNVMVEPDGTFKLVDWELAHIGDPREDIGYANFTSVTQPPDIVNADQQTFYDTYRSLTGLTEEQFNPVIADYFLVLGVGSVFVPVVQQLASVTRGETTAMMVTYMSNAVAGIHEVVLAAMARVDAAMGALR